MNKISQTLASDDPFNAYVKFLALKKHFTTDNYDYFKYNGKVRANRETFMSRNDAYSFAKLAKKDDPQGLILSNILINKNIWIRDLLDSEAEARYTNWRKRIESLGYIFKSELAHLNDEYKRNFISRDGQHPLVMTLLLQKKISLETFTILSHSANIFSYWSEKVVDKHVSFDIINKSKKYKPFLDYDTNRFNTYVKERFDF
jgi:hypothetical protein|tara:strand:+ start:7886 stop:8491 length:606 start_codon:yes stop_codon:yes gene_type:complete